MVLIFLSRKPLAAVSRPGGPDRGGAGGGRAMEISLKEQRTATTLQCCTAALLKG
jgi:hypothetical protein